MDLNDLPVPVPTQQNPAVAFLKQLLLEQRLTETGRVEELRREWAELEATDDYFVPTYANWELVLLMRAQGHEIRHIAQAVDLPVLELLYWFKAPGVVRDMWSLLQDELRVVAETRLMRKAAEMVGPAERPSLHAMELVRSLLDRTGIQVQEPPPNPLTVMMGVPMPLPKGQ